jgi:hypothetical protein
LEVLHPLCRSAGVSLLPLLATGLDYHQYVYVACAQKCNELGLSKAGLADAVFRMILSGFLLKRHLYFAALFNW